MKVDLGCGIPPKTGFTGVTNTDFDFSKGIPYQDNSIEEYYVSHSLEHVSFHKTYFVLSECYRTLTHGGRITVIVPHVRFDAMVTLLSNNPDKMFGNQNDDFDYHKAGFTKEKLKALLDGVGFVNVKVTTIRKTDPRSPEKPWRIFTLGWFLDTFLINSQVYATGVKR